MDKQLDKLEKVIQLIDTDYVTAEDFAESLVVLIQQLKNLDEESEERTENLSNTFDKKIAQIEAFIAKQGEVSTKDKKQLSDTILRVREDIKDVASDLKERIYGIKLRKGEDGKDGKQGPKGDKGDNGSPDEPKDIKKKLESLKGEDRLDAKAIKNLPNATREIIREVGGFRAGAMETPVKDATTGLLLPKDASGAWLVEQGGGGGSSIELQTNGTPNGSQTLLNLVEGTGIIVTDGGTGGVTIASDLTFQVNGSPTPTQTLLNLVAGTGITITDSGAGDVTFDASGSSPFAVNNTTSIFSSNAFPVTSTATNSFFALTDAGSGANVIFSNFIGNSAGLNATNASTSNFFGLSAGQGATNAEQSNFFGNSAGRSSTDAVSSNFFGTDAGRSAPNAEQSNFLGLSAGSGATNSLQSNFFGSLSGFNATDAFASNFFGPQAGRGASNANNSNFFGVSAGFDAVNAANSTFFGDSAGRSAGNASNSFFVGTLAGNTATNAANSVFIGNHSGTTDTVDNVTNPDDWSILFGHYTNTGGFSNSILMGSGTSATPIANTKTNQFMLADSITDVRWRGIEYELPSAQAGAAGYMLSNDSTGVLSWTAVPSIALQTNGSPNGSQFILNLIAGTGITINDDGLGGITIDASAGGATIYTGDGTISGSRTVEMGGNDLNFADSASGNKAGLYIDTAGLRSALGAAHSSGLTSFYVDNNTNTVVVEAGSLQIPAGATAGYVLTSDATGVASWQVAGGASYTFSTGLTDTAGTITANLSTGISGGQSAIGGTAAGDDLTLSSTSNATKGNIFFGTASTYDELNDRFGITQTTPLSKLHINRNDIRVTQSDAYGITLQNATASIVTSGQDVQYSPAMVFRGTEWLTTTGASHTLDYRMFNRPVSGTTAARGGFLIQQSLNGAAYTDLFEIGQTISNQSGYNMRINNATVFALGGGVVQFYGSSSGMGFYNSTGSVAFQTIDANGRHALTPSALTTAATINTWNLAQTWNNASGVYTAHRIAITNTNSSSTSRIVDYLVGGTSVFSIDTTGNTRLGVAGAGIYIKEGTNATSGVATLVAGTVTVNTTKVTANSRIYLTRQTTSGTLGTSVDVTARTAGTSFTITSNGSILDTSDVAWVIIEPAP